MAKGTSRGNTMTVLESRLSAKGLLTNHGQVLRKQQIPGEKSGTEELEQGALDGPSKVRQ